MYQTFYIDIDEEITSIVEKLKSASSREVVMVVPKGALLIQSIINLMVLKKEADELNLQLMIVTQDKLGKFLVEKAGILVQQKMDIEDEKEISEEKPNYLNQQKYTMEEETKNSESKNKMEKIGTENFFDVSAGVDKKNVPATSKAVPMKEKEEEKENIIQKELAVGASMGGSAFGNKKSVSNQSAFAQASFPKSSFTPPVSIPAENPLSQEAKREGNNATKGSGGHQDEKIENFFQEPNSFEKFRRKEKKKDEKYQNYGVPSAFKKMFLSFIFLGVLAGAGVLVYLFVPKVQVVLTPKIDSRTLDSEVVGDTKATSVDFDKDIIPAKVIDIEDEVAKTFSSTGEKSVSNQKASGIITIYNEYGADPQPLVATTRFLSEDGKLFRLVEGVTVPGTQKDGDKLVPGKIEARVVADKPGEDFNIGPTKFTIPGFKDSGSDKYSKFYAKSESDMIGGGDGQNKANSVTQDDIDKAKTELLSQLNDSLSQKAKQLAGKDGVFLDDALNKQEAIYKVSNSPGDVVENFQITVQMKASAIVFSKSDLQELVARMMSDRESNFMDLDKDSISFDFGKADANFETGLIKIKFHAQGNLESKVDTQEIKKAILGKSEKYLKDYLADFSNIESASVEYWPSFVSGRIPFRSGAVSITLDNPEKKE